MRTQVSFQLNNTLMIFFSDNNININCKNNNAGRIISYKYRVIRGAPSQSVACNNSTEFVKRCSYRLLEAIDYFFEFVGIVRLLQNFIMGEYVHPLKDFHVRMHF